MTKLKLFFVFFILLSSNIFSSTSNPQDDNLSLNEFYLKSKTSTKQVIYISYRCVATIAIAKNALTGTQEEQTILKDLEDLRLFWYYVFEEMMMEDNSKITSYELEDLLIKNSISFVRSYNLKPAEFLFEDLSFCKGFYNDTKHLVE